MKKDILLKIDKLGIGLINKESDNTLLNSISFDIPKNKIVGLVGESGSGKSLTALSILRLLNSKIYNTSGKIIFNNKNILELNLAHKGDLIKILGRGKLESPVEVYAHKFSKSAENSIEKAGGKVIKL